MTALRRLWLHSQFAGQDKGIRLDQNLSQYSAAYFRIAVWHKKCKTNDCSFRLKPRHSNLVLVIQSEVIHPLSSTLPPHSNESWSQRSCPQVVRYEFGAHETKTNFWGLHRPSHHRPWHCQASVVEQYNVVKSSCALQIMHVGMALLIWRVEKPVCSLPRGDPDPRQKWSITVFSSIGESSRDMLSFSTKI